MLLLQCTAQTFIISSYLSVDNRRIFFRVINFVEVDVHLRHEVIEESVITLNLISISGLILSCISRL